MELGRRRLVRSILTVLAAALLCACGGERGPGSSVFGSDAAGARRAGSFASAITQAELGRVALPAVDTYLEGLVARLVPSAPGLAVEWRVAVLDQPQAMAVGFEGGHLLVSRGLLVEVEDERALLRVLATEMAHVGLGHATPRLEAMALRVAPGSPGAAAQLALPGLGRPLGSVGSLRASLEAVPYGEEARAEAAPVVDAMLAALMPPGEAAAELFPGALAGLAVGSDPRGGIVEQNRLLHRDLDLSIQFPEGWTVANAADFAGAVAAEDDARIIFQLVADGDDPMVPARAFAQGGGARFGLLPRAREIGGRRAARARGSTEDASLDVTWLVKDEQIYQLSGVCVPEDYDRLQVAFIDVALSLGSAGAQDAARFEPVILHVEATLPGETLARLVARTGGSTWKTSRIALLAGIAPDAPLEAGVQVRVPRRAPLPPPEAALDTAPAAQS